MRREAGNKVTLMSLERVAVNGRYPVILLRAVTSGPYCHVSGKRGMWTDYSVLAKMHPRSHSSGLISLHRRYTPMAITGSVQPLQTD